MITIGIDPGAKGAIAILRLFTLETVDIPLPHDLADLLEILRDNTEEESCNAIVERAQSMPGQGVRSVATYMEGYGTILGIFTALRIPYETVHPSVWKRQMGLTSDKNATREAARRIWPATPFPRADHAEAALLALWWQRHKAGAK